MTVTRSGVSVHEIADRIYRLSIPVPEADFCYNQILIVDDEPLLFHTGLRATFTMVREAVESVMPVERLRYVGLSHFESDECGALNLFLAAAPQAVPLCGRIAAMTSIDDFAERRPRVMGDGEALALGRHTVEWLDTPHLPHGWEAGYLFEQSTRTLLCGDLFTHGGASPQPLISGDLVDLSERFRADFAGQTGMPDPYGFNRDARRHLERMSAKEPCTLALMHGSSWQGTPAEASKMLLALAGLLESES